MPQMPVLIADFLSGKRIAVAGVSRGPGSRSERSVLQIANSGYEVFPVDPNSLTSRRRKVLSNLASISGELDGLVIATHPDVAEQVVRQAARPERSACIVSPVLRPRECLGRGNAGMRASRRVRRGRLPADVLRAR